MKLDKQQVVVTGLRNDGFVEIRTRCRKTRVMRIDNACSVYEIFVNKSGTTYHGMMGGKRFQAKYTPHVGRYYLARARTSGY